MATQMMMRVYIFLSAIAVIAIGVIGANQLDKAQAPAFLLGALTLGGGLLICGLFSIKMFWHGITGAGVLALLGFGRGILNISSVAEFISGSRTRGPAPMLEFAATLICLFLLLRVIEAWRRERTRRLLESDNVIS